MKKTTFIIIAVLLSATLAGCGLAERFQQAEELYIETRVAELLAELPVAEEEQPTVEYIEKEPEATATEEIKMEEEVNAETTKEVEEEEQEQATPQPEPTATLQPTPTVESLDPGEYLGEPAWMDNFDQVKYWVFSSDDFTAATLENGRMKLVAQSAEPGWRIASTEVLKDAYIEAEFEVGKCSAADRYGIIFRVPEKVDYNQGYIFSLTCDGRYSVRMWDGITNRSTWVKFYAASDAIDSGSSKTNRIGVMTIGDRIGLYINGEKVDEIQDDTYTAGFFGVYINRDKTEKLTVTVDNARYWLDPTAK